MMYKRKEVLRHWARILSWTERSFFKGELSYFKFSNSNTAYEIYRVSCVMINSVIFKRFKTINGIFD